MHIVQRVHHPDSEINPTCVLRAGGFLCSLVFGRSFKVVVFSGVHGALGLAGLTSVFRGGLGGKHYSPCWDTL